MNVIVRADASLQLGSGHVMRCLTLAEEVRSCGAVCTFVSRQQAGDRTDLVRRRGFVVHAMADGFSDAEAMRACLESMHADWLVVDHYDIDARWEHAMRSHGVRVLVIDDLANRSHDCDMLVDQNFGRVAADYAGLVPADCLVLAGPMYALLRPEFAARRSESLARRANATLRHILVNFGGLDGQNVTTAVLDALGDCRLPKNARVTVVMGAGAPWADRVRASASRLHARTDVLTDVSDMAALMSSADLAIGAAGTSAWERCCLGLPTVLVIQAENQRRGTTALEAAGAARLISDPSRLREELPRSIADLTTSDTLASLQRTSAAIVDGCGVGRVADALWSFDA